MAKELECDEKKYRVWRRYRSFELKRREPPSTWVSYGLFDPGMTCWVIVTAPWHNLCGRTGCYEKLCKLIDEYWKEQKGSNWDREEI